MTTRRSIFKCIPAMIAAAVLPKAWTARADEPEYVLGQAHPLTLIGEDGPEIIRFNAGDRIGIELRSVDTSGWAKNQWTQGPIRIFVDDPHGFTTEIKNIVSASIT